MKPFAIIVHERKRRFATRQEAVAFAERYRLRTGIILGITQEDS